MVDVVVKRSRGGGKKLNTLLALTKQRGKKNLGQPMKGKKKNRGEK